MSIPSEDLRWRQMFSYCSSRKATKNTNTMVLRRGKPLKGFAGDDSSSDSDDNFAAISAKKKKSGQKRPRSSNSAAAEDTPTNENIADIGDNAAGTTPILPSTETSSNKRHHHANSARQAKM